MHATLEQYIAQHDDRITRLEQQVLALQGQLARAVSLVEGAPAKRGPGRPRKSGLESEPVTFGDAARSEP